MLGLREHRALKVNKDHRESRGRRATWDLLVLKGLKVIKGYRVHKASRVKWGHKERRDLREKLDRKVCRGFREFKVYREKLVQRERMEPMGIRC